MERGSEYRRKKRVARVPASWFGLLPGQPLDFWVRVYWEARGRGIRKSDLEAIRHVAFSERLRQSHIRDTTKRG